MGVPCGREGVLAECVGGLIVELLVSVILWPTLYVFWARPGDKLPPAEQSFMAEGEHVD